MGRMFISLVLVMPRPNKSFGIDFTTRNAACRKKTAKPIESQSAGRLKRSFPECSNFGRKSDVTVRTVVVRFVHCSLCRTGELCHPVHILGGVRPRARGTQTLLLPVRRIPATYRVVPVVALGAKTYARNGEATLTRVASSGGRLRAQFPCTVIPPAVERYSPALMWSSEFDKDGAPLPHACALWCGQSLPKHISQSPQQATLSWISFVPIWVIPGVVWRHGIAAAVGPKVPMRHFHKRDASCAQYVHCFTHLGAKPILLMRRPAMREQTDVRNKVRQCLGRALLRWARRQFAHHAQRPIGDSSAVRFIGHDGFHRSARAHLPRPQPLS